MIAAWTAEGVGTRRVLRMPGKLPGLYMIQTDARGERQFFHWRENSAAPRADGRAADGSHPQFADDL